MTTHQSSQTFIKTALYLTVSLTGATIMIVELLGTRIIGPFYGVSLYVWSSLISVTLIALALGYFLGGKIADRKTRLQLSHVISLSALFLAIIPPISADVLAATDALGIRAGAFTSAVILFTAPLTLLAMVGPIVIARTADDLNIVGSVAGTVYAVSTIGSVIGTLLLGFYLLPEFGSKSIVAALSSALVLLAASWAMFENRAGKGFIWANIPVCLATLCFLSWPQLSPSPDSDGRYSEVFAEESLYGWVRVIDEPRKSIRWLMVDASTIGAANLQSGRGLLQYQRSIKQLPHFNPTAQTALLIGLGSGHLATYLDKHGIVTDSIEIDPAVAKAAQEFFDFKPQGNLIVGDARYHVKQLDKKYDFIIHDCFTGGTDPSHLLTQEMFQDLRRLLNPGGILVVNLVGFLDGAEAKGTQAIARTLTAQFKHSKTYIADLDNRFNDITFFVSDTPLTFRSKIRSARLNQWLNQHEYSFPATDGFVLSDNYNPLDRLQVKKAERYRAQMIDRVGKQLLLN